MVAVNVGKRFGEKIILRCFKLHSLQEDVERFTLQTSMLFISTGGRMVFYFGRFSQSVAFVVAVNV